jgi:predicted TIM-barrel enzyme
VFSKVDGLIVGSYFKKAGKGGNLVEEARVRAFTDTMASLKRGG